MACEYPHGPGSPHSHDPEGVWCAIEIFDRATGETAAFEDCGSIWNDEGYIRDFMWAEGNYACDCNRQLFFERALGRRDPFDNEAVKCGEGRYLARATRLDNGEIIFDEIGERPWG